MWEEFTQSLSEEEAQALEYQWDFWARDKQLAPPGDWSVWLILSGRGFGKTRTGAEWLKARAESGKYKRFAIIGQTAADVRDVMIEGESGILSCYPSSQRPLYEPSKRRLTFPNGVVASTFSGDEPGQLRGPQFDSAWADEPAKWKFAQEAWDNLEFGLRLGDNPQVVATTTPRPIPLIRTLIADPQTVVTRGHTDENMANLSERYVERVIRKFEGTRLGRQELAGEILDDNPNALWKRALIESLRVKPSQVPDLVRIVVSVDPQVADPNATEQNEQDKQRKTAETGITVSGMSGGAVPHFYLLDDCSLSDSPNEWANAAVDAFLKHEADRLVAETNQGGAMVEFTVKTVANARGIIIPYTGVHASRGKYTRAEPIAALYEQGRVHHVGNFPELEDQMCDWVPGTKSPDRMDSAVWGLTALSQPKVEKPKTTPVKPQIFGFNRR